MRIQAPSSSRLSSLLVAVLAVGGCDAAADAVDPALARHGLEQAVVEPDAEGSYRLLDDDGHSPGLVELEGDDGAGRLTIELDGERSTLRWSEEGASLQCSDGPAVAAGDGRERPLDLVSDECMDALYLAGALAEAEGIDVPGYGAPTGLEGEGPEARSACETVNTHGSTCNECRNKAIAASVYSEHTSGSCTAGWFDVTCSHTFCSGGGGTQIEVIEM